MIGVSNLNNSPNVLENPSKNRQEIVENSQRNENFLSPGFRSVAAKAGWDEEALLIASLIVEDTPDRQCKQKKRSLFNNLKTPPTNSRRKQRAQRRSPEVPVVVLDLDEDEPKPKLDNGKECKVEKTDAVVGGPVHLDKDEAKSKLENEKVSREEKTNEKVNAESSGVPSSSSSPAIPCIDRLREELSCAICLEICYEPSTTSCGHSFCKKCLRSAADRCGKKCPKCRQLISNGRYCTVNTVLWNTIQLLFPHEVEARKAAGADSASDCCESQGGVQLRSRRRVFEASNDTQSNNNSGGARRRRGQSLRVVRSSSRRDVTSRELPGQEEDAALALRLQREEFMEAFAAAPDEQRSTIATAPDERRSTVTTATANLRAMASATAPDERRSTIADEWRITVTTARANLRAMASATAPDERRSMVTTATANLRAMASRAMNIRSRSRRDF